ncbi:MAG TPA: ATP-dependent metallopeptidase FtsH/Yme1/Tma family protein, partial [Marmoricola sp.]
MKRILRGPWLWIGLAGLGVIIALQYLVPNGGYKEVETSKMTAYIEKGEIKEVTFVDGGDQEIRAELDNGKKVMATWVDGQQVGLVNEVQDQVDSGDIKEFNVKNPQPSLLGSLAATILPFIIIVVI